MASLVVSKMYVWKCLLKTFSFIVCFTAMASAQPKVKPPPPKESDYDSDEGAETSDEETEDEEQAEGSDFESESDKSTDTTKKKLTSILPMKQQVRFAYVFHHVTSHSRNNPVLLVLSCNYRNRLRPSKCSDSLLRYLVLS